jgi:hypothetical protein
MQYWLLAVGGNDHLLEACQHRFPVGNTPAGIGDSNAPTQGQAKNAR